MASPSIVGGLGGGAESNDKADAERARIKEDANREMRRSVEIQRRQNDKREARIGPVEATDVMSVPDAIDAGFRRKNDEMLRGYIDDSQQARPGSNGFRNVDRDVAIQTVDQGKKDEVDATRAAAEALSQLKTGAMTVTMALVALGRAAGTTNALQETGAMNANQLEATVRASAAKMNLTKEQEDAAVDRMKTAGGTSNLSQAQYAAAFLGAGRRKLPGMMTEQVMDAISQGMRGDVSPDEAIEYASSDIPQEAAIVGRIGSRQGSRAARRIGATIANVPGKETEGDFRNQSRGNRLRDIKADIRNAKQDSWVYSLTGSSEWGADIGASMILDAEEGAENEALLMQWQSQHSTWQALTTSGSAAEAEQRETNKLLRKMQPGPPSTEAGN